MQSTSKRRLVLQQQHRQSVSTTMLSLRQLFDQSRSQQFSQSPVTSSNTRTTSREVGKSGDYISFSLKVYMTHCFPIVLEVHHEHFRRTLHNRCILPHQGNLDCWRMVHRYQGSTTCSFARFLLPQVRGGRSHDRRLVLTDGTPSMRGVSPPYYIYLVY